MLEATTFEEAGAVLRSLKEIAEKWSRRHQANDVEEMVKILAGKSALPEATVRGWKLQLFMDGAWWYMRATPVWQGASAAELSFIVLMLGAKDPIAESPKGVRHYRWEVDGR